MISHDLEAREGRKEEPISLNKIKSEKAGASRPEFYLRGGIPSVITGLGDGFPSMSQGRMHLAGYLFNSSKLSPGAAGASCPGVPRYARLCAKHFPPMVSLNLHSHPRKGAIMIPILHVSKLRLSDLPKLTQLEK